MNDGYRILRWAQQNQHTLTWMAEKLGYSRQALSESLHHNRISPRLAEALFNHFALRVMVDGTLTDQDNNSGHPKPKPVTRHRRGRSPGSGSGPGASRLDPYRAEIEQLLANGSTQRFIASRFETTESNLYNWLKKRGLKRNRIDTRDNVT
jgi:hypothetical protein